MTVPLSFFTGNYCSGGVGRVCNHAPTPVWWFFLKAPNPVFTSRFEKNRGALRAPKSRFTSRFKIIYCFRKPWHPVFHIPFFTDFLHPVLVRDISKIFCALRAQSLKYIYSPLCQTFLMSFFPSSFFFVDVFLFLVIIKKKKTLSTASRERTRNLLILRYRQIWRTSFFYIASVLLWNLY